MGSIDLAKEMLKKKNIFQSSEKVLQKQIETEFHLLLVCQLLEVLEEKQDQSISCSNLCFVPLKIRLLSQKERQQMILEMLSTNPSHYRTSLSVFNWAQETFPHFINDTSCSSFMK
jgi:hypothetical protein